MNKKIKSGSEIKKEINSLFYNYKSENKLANSIKSYLDNISGKELIKRSEIKSIILIEILKRDAKHKSNLRFNKKLVNVFPFLKRYNSLKSLLPTGLGDLSSFISDNSFMLVITDIIMMCKDFEKFRKMEGSTDTIYKQIMIENEAFRKLFMVLSKHKDVSKLLVSYLSEAKQKYHTELIIQKIIPLNSIFIYFDRDLDVKGNTEKFYLLLNKKFPKNTIQTAIHDNLEKIRADKFSYPHLLIL
jgi:hypothetical protein